MASRLSLHQKLKALQETVKVYFQPPETVKMTYPCIKYELDGEDAKFANNKLHIRTKRYTVTVIDPDPDSLIPDKVGVLPMCKFNRKYTKDNLNHFVYILYY